MPNGHKEPGSTEVALIDSIGNAELKEIGLDMGKLTVDLVFQSDLIESVPIIGHFARVYKTYASIRDRGFLLKVLMFLDEFTQIPGDVRQRFTEEVARDEGSRARAGATLTLLLDRLDDLEKPKLIGRLYVARLKGEISYADLRRFCMVVDRAYVPDLVALSKLAEGDRVDNTSAPLLNALGLVEETGTDYGKIGGVGAETWYQVNGLGRKFLSVAFNR